VTAQVAAMALLLAIPEVLVRTDTVSPFALAPTSEIFSSFGALMRSGAVVAPLVETLILVFITFIIVAIVGLVVGFSFWRWGLARRAFEPLMLAVYAIPAVIFYPILLVVLGIGAPSIIGLGFMLGLIPVVLGVQNALGGIDPVLGRTATVLGASSFDKYFKVIFPAALPDIGGALRLGLSYVVIGIISGQFLVSTGGLGKLVANFYDRFQVADVYAASIFIILLAACLNAILEKLK
jgi:ABC-type nitrate/sulfonate/bicarbonate transport system permease component